MEAGSGWRWQWWKKKDENRHKTFITFYVMEGKFIIVGAAEPSF
jgi:hypothetical protein